MKLEPVRPSRGPGAGPRLGAWRAPVEGHAPGTAWLVLGGLAILAALGIAALPADAQAPASRLAILAFSILAAWRVLGRAAKVTASSAERFEDALRTPPATVFEIPGLRAIETDVRMSTASAFGVEMRLKPALRDLARWRLERDHGVDLDRQPDAARRVLGDALWRLVAPADAFPEFRAPGVALGEVEAGVERLEGI
ncbi:MAG TPA: hypothetical protein VE011_10615 [Candidatus Dormibacteraeota bacterium]|nr:hypothetical protein [Candidatus Dormibacteraeota bacterium]